MVKLRSFWTASSSFTPLNLSSQRFTWKGRIVYCQNAWIFSNFVSKKCINEGKDVLVSLHFCKISKTKFTSLVNTPLLEFGGLDPIDIQLVDDHFGRVPLPVQLVQQLCLAPFVHLKESCKNWSCFEIWTYFFQRRNPKFENTGSFFTSKIFLIFEYRRCLSWQIAKNTIMKLFYYFYNLK